MHRDVKPANILIDGRGCPFVADFGIALSEDDYGREASTAGTLRDMSPEQLRGEGHLVDGRSDIFSLGIVLYELLTGRRPFSASRHSDPILAEARPPRQVNDSIPRNWNAFVSRPCPIAWRIDTRRPSTWHRTCERSWPREIRPEPRRRRSPIHRSRKSAALSRASRSSPLFPGGCDRSIARMRASFLACCPGRATGRGFPTACGFGRRASRNQGQSTFRIGLIYGPAGAGNRLS